MPPDQLLVVGANHRSSSAWLRDKLFMDERAAPEFLLGLRRNGVRQAVVLSTCDRVEIQAVHSAPGDATRAVVQALAARAALSPEEIAGELYTLVGSPALRQVFAVAASLDSQVVGEPQVLGQVKAGYRLAREIEMLGPELDTVLNAAFGAARRVRNETAIGEGPVSMAAVAVRAARDLHGDLRGRRALLAGVGDMGVCIARQFGDAGVERLQVAGPLPAAAERVARELECHVLPFDELADGLAQADVVVTCIGRRDHLLGTSVIERALKTRRRRPIFLVDAGVPGDVDPAVEALDGAFRYDLDDLERLASQSRSRREREATAAWCILEEELSAFAETGAARVAVPTVSALRSRFEAAREEVLFADPEADAAEATRRLVNRLLHAPSAELRALAGRTGRGDARGFRATERIVRALFRLDRTSEPEDEA